MMRQRRSACLHLRGRWLLLVAILYACGWPVAGLLAQSSSNIEVGFSMVGGSFADGGDDVGPARQVQDMIEAEHPAVTFSGMVRTTWAAAQPIDPGPGPDVYDWTDLDREAGDLIAGKALVSYYQMWGASPAWADWENDPVRFWAKFEAFVEAMTIHINQNYGPVYYIFENEPNIPRTPPGWSWEDWYIESLSHFYPAVHAADGQTGMDNKVIVGNLAGHTAGGFNDLYARGLKDISDILGYHAYPYDLRDGLDVGDLAMIHAIQESYGDGDKQVFVSEGWGSGRSAGFDRSDPRIPPTALEIENMYLAMVNGWDNVMTPRTNWHPDYLWGMRFFTGNDNWGAMNWRSRATPIKDGNGHVTGFHLDGYQVGLDIAPYFWNGGMFDFFGNSKDCLTHVFPGDGLALMNPGFELSAEPPDAHLPQFWSTEAASPPQSRYTLDDSTASNAGRSLRLSLATAGSDGVYQWTPKRSASEGVSYRARVMCKSRDVADGQGARFYMSFCNIEGTRIGSRYYAPAVLGTTEWQQLEVIATSPAGTSRIRLGCQLNGVGDVWFDDVTVSESALSAAGTVRGYTLDESQVPIPFCVVRTTTGSVQAVSDANGFYEINGAPSGTFDFVCRQTGYVPHRVMNQTVAAGKLTFVNFSMQTPKSGLTVAQVKCDRTTLPINRAITASVTVQNTKPYPNRIEEVSLFVEQAGVDVTDRFHITPMEGNPGSVPAAGQATFKLKLTATPQALDQAFELNAYAYGQEDRPNRLLNSELNGAGQWDQHWDFTCSAQTCSWQQDATTYHSPPYSARNYISDNTYTWWNWARNHSANSASAPPSSPATRYTVGVYHKDNVVGGVALKLYIMEYYYNGTSWYRNGERWAAIPPRRDWGHDVMIYRTGDPGETPGLYPTNRLLVACGPQTTPEPGSGDNWWDDLYLKETGDWLADDRADQSWAFAVIGERALPDFDFDIDVDLNDFSLLQSCFTGVGVPIGRDLCIPADLDGDNDVDQSDHVLFLGCLGGSNVVAVPDCAD